MNLQALFLPLIDLQLKGAIILVVGLVCLALARNASAANRHAILVGVIGALLLLPMTKLVDPHWSLTVGQTSVPMVQVELPDEHSATSTVATEATSSSQLQAAPVATSPLALPWEGILPGAWLGGTILLVARRIYVGFRLRALARSGMPIQDARLLSLIAELASSHGMRVTARESTSCKVPLVAGVLRPVVLLPALARHWSETELESALCHEFGHIRRCDCLARLAVDLAQALYWLNPLVWVIARNLRIAQEQACDDLVLTSGAAPEAYATQLVNVVRSLQGDDFTSRHALAMAQPSTLETRVVAIMDAARKRDGRSGSGTFAGAGCVVAMLAVCAAAQLEGAPDPIGIVPDWEKFTEAAGNKARVMIEAKIFEAPGDEEGLPEFMRGTELSSLSLKGEDAIKNLQTANRLKLVAAPKLITHSGQRAGVRTTRDYSYPADWEKDVATGAWKPKKMAAENLGLSFEITPNVEAHGVIDLDLVSKFVELADLRDLDDPRQDQKANPARMIPDGHRSQPVFATRKVTTTVGVMSGGTVAIGGFGPSPMVFVITANVVSADGRPVAEPKQGAPVETESPSGGAAPVNEAVPEKDVTPAKETAPVKDASAKETTPAKLTTPAKETDPAKKPDLDPINIDANTFDASGAVTTAEGNVRVLYQDVTIMGDRMTYDTKSRAVTLTGNVRFEKGGKEITAENLTYWLDNGRIDTKGPSKVRLKDAVVPKR